MWQWLVLNRFLILTHVGKEPHELPSATLHPPVLWPGTERRSAPSTPTGSGYADGLSLALLPGCPVSDSGRSRRRIRPCLRDIQPFMG